MSSPNSASLDLLFELVSDSTHVAYAAVAVVAWIVFDIILTFRAEMDLLWPARLSVSKCLYFVIRYFTLLNLCFATVTIMGRGWSIDYCQVYVWYFNFAGPVVTAIAGDLLLVLRLLVLYEGSRRMRVFIMCLFTVDSAIKIVSAGLILSSVGLALDIPAEVRVIFPGCVLAPPTFIFMTYVSWGYHAFTCCVYVCLSAWRFFAGLGNEKIALLRKSSELRPTMHLFIRDNTAYFLIVLAATLTWIVLETKYPNRPTQEIGIFFLMAVYDVTAARLVLNLRRSTTRRESYLQTRTSRGMSLEFRPARVRVNGGMSYLGREEMSVLRPDTAMSGLSSPPWSPPTGASGDSPHARTPSPRSPTPLLAAPAPTYHARAYSVDNTRLPVARASYSSGWSTQPIASPSYSAGPSHSSGWPAHPPRSPTTSPPPRSLAWSPPPQKNAPTSLRTTPRARNPPQSILRQDRPPTSEGTEPRESTSTARTVTPTQMSPFALALSRADTSTPPPARDISLRAPTPMTPTTALNLLEHYREGRRVDDAGREY